MKPEKRDPYGENPDVLHDGCAWCDECGGDGGGEYCKGFSPSLDGPDYEYVECSACEGTGQVRLDGKPHDEPETPWWRKGPETRSAEEIARDKRRKHAPPGILAGVMKLFGARP